ncbi:DUF2511 domain-containing protein [Rhodococcoides yunnanense]|uniref:DUF2511 domain-containing protein n=1 Tax=Rhodococcoides yunnanense TaxID=278209 RepID=UPI000934228C|nr:DUF2511 domain-containing protein [Rhodococcus yunnanensis]
MRNSWIVGTAVLALMLAGCADEQEATPAVDKTHSTVVVPTDTRATLRLETPASAAPAQPPAATAANVPAGFVSETGWTGEWPFTVSEGVLMCARPQRVTFTSGRTIYALNGSATTAGGFEDVASIWKDSSFPGVKVDIGPMIERGLGLC